MNSLNEEYSMFQLPRLPVHFVARETPLNHLRSTLEQTDKEVKIQAVYGPSGIGKTLLVLHYAHSQRGYYQRIIWIRANVDLDGQLRELAQTWFGIKHTFSMPGLMQRIYKQLANERVLLIFDELDHPEYLAVYLPPASFKGHLHLIITHSHEDMLNIPTFKLEQFTHEEARAYIHRQLGSQPKEQIHLLLEALKNFPPALALAVAYIVQNNDSFTNYLHQFFHWQPYCITTDLPTVATMRTSLAVALSWLQKEHLQARAVLQHFIGLAANHPIPLALIADIEKINIVLLYPLIIALSRYNLLDVNQEEDTASIHPLLLELLNDTWPTMLARETHLKRVAQILMMRLNCDHQNLQALAFATLITAHALHLIEMLPPTLVLEKADLLHQLGRYYAYSTGQYRASLPCLERALIIYEFHLGPHHINVMMTLGSLARTELLLNWPYFAFKHAHRCLSLCQSTEGEFSQKTLFIKSLIQQCEEKLNQLPKLQVLMQDGFKIDNPLLERMQTNFKLSLSLLGEQQPEALTVLKHFLGLTAVPIPLLLLATIQQIDLNTLTSILMTLSHYSLLHFDLSRKIVNIQRLLLPLLHALWTDLLAREAHLKWVAQILIDLLDYDKDDADAKLLAEQIFTVHAQHLIGLLPPSLELEKANLLYQLGCHYQEGIGQSDKAKTYFEGALAIQEPHYNQALMMLVRTQSRLGKIHHQENFIQEDMTVPVNTPELFHEASDLLLKKYKIEASISSSAHWFKLLQMAIISDCLGDVRYCIEVLKLDINYVDFQSGSHHTPLHWAAIKNSPRIVTYLISKNAQTHLKDAHGKTAVDYALEEGDHRLMAAFGLNSSPHESSSPKLV